MDLRSAINRQLTQQGMSRYKLAQRVAGRVPPSTIYGFLRGQHPINSDALDHIMGAVGLTLTANPDADNVTPLTQRKTSVRASKGRVTQ